MACFFCFNPSTAADQDENKESPAVAPETELVSYFQDACRLDPELAKYNLTPGLDPDLPNFNFVLRRSTSRVVFTAAVDASSRRSLSFDTLKDASGSLLCINKSAFSTILDLKEEISSDPDLVRFVAEFFKNHAEILNFFSAVRSSFAQARETQSLLVDALRCLATAEVASDCSVPLEKLRKFTEAGNAFTAKFISEFKKVVDQHKRMISSLCKKKSELGQKLKTVRAWRKVYSVVFGVIVAGVIISSIVLAVVAAPAVAAASAAAVAAVEPVKKCCGSFWNGWEGKWKRKMGAVERLQKDGSFAIDELETIRVQVEKLEILIGFNDFDGSMEFFGEDEASVKKAVEEMRERVVELGKKMEMMEEEMERRCREIRKKAAEVLQSISNNQEI